MKNTLLRMLLALALIIATLGVASDIHAPGDDDSSRCPFCTYAGGFGDTAGIIALPVQPAAPAVLVDVVRLLAPSLALLLGFQGRAPPVSHH